MFDQKEFLKVKKGLQSATNNNYRELLGFLQRFYSINVVREIASQDDELKGEVNSLIQESLVELYNSDSANKYINGLVNVEDDRLRMRVTTMALLDEVFPEFIDGSFNPNSVKSEERKIATMFISSTEAYKNKSNEFKSAFNRLMSKPVERNGYTEVTIAPELKASLYDDDATYQR